MKRYIVLSVNDNPEYLFYLPLTVWAWRKFGWEPIIFKVKSQGRTIQDSLIYNLAYSKIDSVRYFYTSNSIEYPSEMIAQISRLYAACTDQIGYLMTGDVDMLPLSDYWKFDPKQITVWGRDLTDYHYPICYIGMPTYKWMEVMNITSPMYSDLIKRDLDSMPNAKSEDQVKRWVVDQDLITERLNNCGLPITRIDRGMYPNGYPIGRIDRSAWTLEHDQLIDCHMPRGIYSNQSRMDEMMGLLEKIWPNEDFGWFVDYKYQFKKLING